MSGGGGGAAVSEGGGGADMSGGGGGGVGGRSAGSGGGAGGGTSPVPFMTMSSIIVQARRLQTSVLNEHPAADEAAARLRHRTLCGERGKPDAQSREETRASL